MLWLACQFPSLAVEVPPGATGVGRVAVDGVVRQACPLAQAAGIQPGMRVATARALLSPLEVRHTDAASRGRALADLAPRLATIIVAEKTTVRPAVMTDRRTACFVE